MGHRNITATRQASRPRCEGLESRALLSTVTASHLSAEVHALAKSTPHFVASRSPLLPNLAATPQVTGSTSAPTGDLSPYGVAFVGAKFAKGGALKAGDVLVSNFNDAGNLQGTGTSIVKVTPGGASSVFATTPAGTGLSSVGVLSRGFVVAGNLPSTDGTSATASAGSLYFFDKGGKVVGQYSNPTLLNGPWNLTVVDHGSHASIFVSNVLSGTVTRLDVVVPSRGNHIVVKSATEIASGYTYHGDPAAFEVGPTGLAYNAKTGTLYVASTADNAIYAIPMAEKARHSSGTGKVVFADQAYLHGPLGLAFTANGDLITANGDGVNPVAAQSGELVEFTTKGKFVGQLQVNPAAGSAFGLAVQSHGNVETLAAVDDALNQLDLFTAR